MKPTVLVVEDERGIQIALAGLLRKEGYEVRVAGSGTEALATLETGPLDLVLTDLSLGDGPTGLDVLRASKRTRPEVPVVLITAFGSERTAVEAMKGGAEDYVPQALRQRRDPARGPAGARSHPPRPGASPPPRAHRAGPWPRRPHRERRRDAAGLRGHPQGRAHRSHGPGPRRERDRQGAGGPGASRQEPAADPSLRGRELRRDQPRARRERALRSREGGVHGCGPPAPRRLRGGRRGDAPPRRDRGHAPRDPGQDPPRSPGATGPAGRGAGGAPGRRPGGGRDAP